MDTCQSHWFRHITVYVPIITNSSLFYNGQNIQMAVGEAWVVNPTTTIDADNILLAIEIPKINQYNTLHNRTISYLANYSTPINLAT